MDCLESRYIVNARGVKSGASITILIRVPTRVTELSAKAMDG